MDQGAPTGPGPAQVVRWGLGDAAWIYPAGLLAAGIGAAVGHGIAQDTVDHPGALTTALGAAGMYAAWIVGLTAISRRKGRGSLRSDFGFVVNARDVWALLVGLVLQVALGATVYFIVELAPDEKQSVVDELRKAGGAKLWVLIIVAAFVAPVMEELFFRGFLLRAMRRRWSPEIAIGVSALVFALLHPLLDPQLVTFAIVPALFALGVISGVAAVWTGELSISIALHIGFNLFTVATLGFLRF